MRSKYKHLTAPREERVKSKTRERWKKDRQDEQEEEGPNSRTGRKCEQDSTDERVNSSLRINL